MSSSTTYRHTQGSPLCWLIYGMTIPTLITAWVMRGQPPLPWVIGVPGIVLIMVAASFHHLMVADDDDALLVSFGPLPLIRRRIKYAAIVGAQVGRTQLLDGWGIHYSSRGGWVWNIWGRDCVELQLQQGKKFFVGTDDAENLAAFLQSRISSS